MSKAIASAIRGVLVAVLCSLSALNLRAQTKTLAERLGYPADARLLMIHADDLAVAHSVDEASFAALEQKAVTAASVMIPCAWVAEVGDYALEHPDADLGLHLTLTSEWKAYRWGPRASKNQVMSLLSPQGYFWPEAGLAASHARPEEVERELRAQIDVAMRVGILPTHLDSHMGTLFQNRQLFSVYVKVAHEYHLPFLAVRVNDERKEWISLLSPGDILLDSVIMFRPGVPPEQWTESYVKALQGLEPGLHELIVHLGHDDGELEAIALDHPDYGAAWRERDFRAVTSPQFKKALEENHIILLGWKDLKKLVP